MKKVRPVAEAKGFFAALYLSLVLVPGGVAQTSLVPVITVEATQPIATVADAGVFTVFRAGDTNATLNVWYELGGTASNGVDYAAISPHLVAIPAGAISNNIVITPLTNPPAVNAVRTVVLTLTNSPLMTPINYQIGSPSRAVVFIAATNPQPVVAIFYPANGAVFTAPANIPLIAKASDPDGSVSNLEFFANGADLGAGLPVVLDPPGMGGVTGLVYFFNWQNVPTNDYVLTAVATDNAGAGTTSAPVKITVQLPLTNLPPIVRIISPPNGAVFRAPMQIPVFAFAADFDDAVASVQFFAAGASIGFGHPVTSVPLAWPTPIIQPTNFWEFTWTNPPEGISIPLTVVADDDRGLSTTSNPVLVSILPSLPPPTNRPAIVRIVATDPVAIEGTNCWTWPGLAAPAATWSNWFAPTATFCLFTNCGPKNATFSVFRFGDTNNDLNVAYAIGGSATNGVDYVTLPGTVTIPAGARRADITIVPLDNGPPDIASTVILKLVPDTTGTNYFLGYPRAAAIILDSQSPRAATGIIPGGGFNLTAAGPDGAWFHVEYSTDLLHWTPICTNQVVNGSIDFVDPDAAANPLRYYRTVPEAGPPE
jgi:hypothetical protein